MSKQNLSEVPRQEGLTLLCHQDDIEIVNDRDDVLEITPEDTVAMTAKFTDAVWEKAKLDEDFKERLGILFPDLDIVTDTRRINEYPLAHRHVIGMIICINKAINTGKTPYVRYPETYLHPSTQAKLGSLFAKYVQDSKDSSAAVVQR